MIKSFHPQHLSDLRKSGLLDATIEAAGIYTVLPGEIGKKCSTVHEHLIHRAHHKGLI